MADTIAQVSSSIEALTKEFEVITNNLANTSTVGYKRRCNTFSRLLEEQQSGEEAEPTYEVALDTKFDFSQGNVVESGRPLDFALYGKGFFVIETPEGPLYTRNGTFSTDRNGQIVDMEGRMVAGEAGPITVPAGVGVSQITISNDGTVSAKGTPTGKFRLVNFGNNESKLIPVGGNCFKMGEEGVEPVKAEHIVVKQGYQESSNVNIVDELVDMIMVSRLYEANMKFLAAQKETSSSIMSVAMG